MLQSRDREIEEGVKSKDKQIKELLESKDQIKELLESKEREIESKDRDYREMLESKDGEIKDKDREIEELRTRIKTKQVETQGVRNACRLLVLSYIIVTIIYTIMMLYALLDFKQSSLFAAYYTH